MRGRVIVAVAVLGHAVAVSAGESLDETLAWLETRTAELREADPPAGREEVSLALEELRGRLKAAGLSESVAEALVATPVRPVDGEEESALASLRTTRLRLTRFARGVSRGPPTVPAAGRPALEEILADPVFRDASDRAGVLQRVQFAVQRFLGRIMERLLRFVGSNSTIVLVLAIAGALAALVFVATRLASIAGPRRRPAESGATSAGRTAGDAVAASTLLRRASAEARAGGWGRAVRLAEQAAVLALVEGDFLPAYPGLTDLEGLRSFRDRGEPEVRSDFEELVDLHDGIVFGGRAPDAAAAGRATTLARRLVDRPTEDAA